MAMDPTPQNALDQHQSLLFRLPRELRDEIYYYYSQANGYYYDSTSGTLRMDGGECIDLSLQYTCKRTAAEMQGIALGINTITFRTMLDLPRPSDQLMKSQIFGYHIDEGRGAILSRMLEWTYPLVTAETMRKLCERHPANLAVKKMRELHREGDSDGPLARGHLWGELEDVDTAGTQLIMKEIGMWISETKALFVLGMLPGSYNLVLHGPSPLTSQQICDATVRVAIWEEGCTSIAKADTFQGHYFVQFLGEGFVEAIKGVVEGSIPARFDADMGKIWDIDQLMKEKDGDWPSDLEDVFEIRNLEQPPEGWCAAHEERFGVWEHRDYIEVDWTEYMEGVDMLFKQNEVNESD